MSQTVITKNEIVLLPTETLVLGVKWIEELLPGWWWSLSQTAQARGKIQFSAGPGMNCPSGKDRCFAKTDIGDKGFSRMFYRDHPNTDERFLNWISHMSVLMLAHRKVIDASYPGWEKDPETASFRYQTMAHYSELESQHGVFLSNIGRIEQEGYCLEEFYLGSCDTSVDCSLRGTRPDDSKFDISVDLAGQEDGLGTSLRWAFVELANDVIMSKEVRPN